MKLSIVVVSFRTRELTLVCLRSLAGGLDGVTAEVIVVDNHSGDGTAEAVAEQHPDVRLVALDENLGFARAANLAVETATGTHILLLNPDTVVWPGSVAALVDFARAHPEYGVYGGRTVTSDGALDPRSCWGSPGLWSTVCFATGLSTAFRRSRLFDPESLGRWDRATVRHVEIVSGCLLLVPRVLWDRLGGFDPAFFLYGEDADLCLRAARLGCRPAITPDAVVAHVGGASSDHTGAKRTLVLKGKVTLMRKHWSPPAARLGVALLLLGTALRASGERVIGGDGWRHAWQQRAHWRPGYGA